MIENFDQFYIRLGDPKGSGYRQVYVKVARGIDRNGISTYLIRDVQPDGSSYYAKMLYQGGNLQGFLQGIFAHSRAEGLLDAWIKELEHGDGLSVEEKEARLRQFTEGLIVLFEGEFEKLDGSNPAMTANPGGIKFDNIKMDVRGSLSSGIMSDKELEALLVKARGLSGTIVGMAPIADLPDFIR